MAPETNEILAGGHGRAKLLGSAASLRSPTVLEGYLTASELATQIHRSVRTLARWRAIGEGPPCLRLGREIYYKKSSVAAWLASLEQDA
jgi:hypothetical protein